MYNMVASSKTVSRTDSNETSLTDENKGNTATGPGPWGRVPLHGRRAVGLSLLTVGLIVALGFLVSHLSVLWTQYRQVSEQSTMAPIRSMILSGIDNIGVAAPIEPKTGDIYLPPIELRLPANYDSNDTRSTYKYSWDASSKHLTVIDQGVVAAASNKLYNAQDLNDMFSRVPEVQACSRGVVFLPAGEEFDQDWKLQGSIQPAGEETARWDLYIDKACPQNAIPASVMLGLKPY